MKLLRGRDYKKAPKGHIYKRIRTTPTIRQFIWDLFDKGVVPNEVNRIKIAAMVNEKFKDKRILHPEYTMKQYQILKYYYPMWKKTRPENHKAWRKI